jgi:hypothetical protein
MFNLKIIKLEQIYFYAKVTAKKMFPPARKP